jgi:hypothetical protein
MNEAVLKEFPLKVSFDVENDWITGTDALKANETSGEIMVMFLPMQKIGCIP